MRKSSFIPPKIAALLTSMSSPPKRSTAASAQAVAEDSSETSVCWKKAWPPASTISAATRAPCSSDTSATTTLAPSAASALAYSSPIPPAAPVTIAVLPSKRPMAVCLLKSGCGAGVCEGAGSGRGGDGLDLEIFLEARAAHLAADAGLLVAAEGHVGAVPLAAVDAERAGADPGHDLLDPL